MALVLPMFAASVHVTRVNLNIIGKRARGWRGAPAILRTEEDRADRGAIGRGSR